jgi:CheY-like chemotaxis protein
MANPNTDTGMEKNSCILVADDNEVNQKVAQLMLQKSGYRVDLVENGQQAVEANQQNRYDLILMDIQMPLMDGLKATEEIRKWENGITNSECGRWNQTGENSDLNSAFRIPTSDFKGVPIIAMSGSAAEGRFDEKLYPGMNDCIGKPLQRDYLLSVVLKWIRAKSNTPTNENPGDETRSTDPRPEKNDFPLDLDRAIQEFMGQKEILFGVLQKFINSAGSQIDTIRQAVKGADYGRIGAEAHAIKGAAANLTADKLARRASELEHAAEKQQADLIAELAGKLEREFCYLEKYIQQNLELRNR